MDYSKGVLDGKKMTGRQTGTWKCNFQQIMTDPRTNRPSITRKTDQRGHREITDRKKKLKLRKTQNLLWKI